MDARMLLDLSREDEAIAVDARVHPQARTFAAHRDALSRALRATDGITQLLGEEPPAPGNLPT